MSRSIGWLGDVGFCIGERGFSKERGVGPGGNASQLWFCNCAFNAGALITATQACLSLIPSICYAQHSTDTQCDFSHALTPHVMDSILAY